MTDYRVSAFVSAVMADMPVEDPKARRARIVEAFSSAMAPECRALHEKYPGCLRTHTLHWFEFGGIGDGHEARIMPVGNLSPKQIEKILKPFAEEVDARNQVEAKLRATFKGFRTVEAALKALPEFEKYLSPAAAGPSTKNLPALTNVISDLAKLGWPKKKE